MDIKEELAEKLEDFVLYGPYTGQSGYISRKYLKKFLSSEAL